MRIYPILLLTAGTLVSACDDATGPATATLQVSTHTVGDDPDPDGYLLRMDNASLDLEPTGTAGIALTPGRRTLRLLGVASHCSVAPSATLEVEVLPGTRTPVSFEVNCPGTGVRVTTATAGRDVDPNGYRVVVDGSDLASVPSRGSVYVRLDPGSRLITLTGLAPNCTIDGSASHTVTIRAEEVVPVDFAVACTATTPLVNITGNWQFRTTPTAPGIRAMTIAGSFTQSGSAVSGAVHATGSNCLDSLTTINLTGTLRGYDFSLTSTPTERQVITLTGATRADSLAGTYSISGGCADGARGDVRGAQVRPISGTWRIIFSWADQHVGKGLATLSQASTSSEGGFGVAGRVSNSIPRLDQCYSGTVTGGGFPSHSFIMGRSVTLEIDTRCGTIVFRGTVFESGAEISGRYQVLGGTHDGRSGPACLGRDIFRNCYLLPY